MADVARLKDDFKFVNKMLSNNLSQYNGIFLMNVVLVNVLTQSISSRGRGQAHLQGLWTLISSDDSKNVKKRNGRSKKAK